MITLPPRSEWFRLARYYLAGVVNLGFAYLLLVLLLWLGLQVYVAQAVGYVIGIMFNYLTYSKIAFTGDTGQKTSYVASYIVNYLLSVSLLWVALKFIESPYTAGLIVTLAVSLINYLLLRRFVFRAPARG